MTRRLAFHVLIVMLALGLGCGDSGDYVSVGEGADRRLPGEDPLDGSTLDGSGDGDGDGDGSTSMDGSMSGDGSIFDSLELPDGSILLDDGAIQLPDGEVIDEETAEVRYGMELDVRTCELSELDHLSLPVTFGDEGGYAIAPSGSSGFGLVVRSGATDNCTESVGVARLPSMGALSSPEPILPDCKVIRDVALLGVVGAYHLAWVDNATNTAELHRVMLDRDMNVMGPFARTTITDSVAEIEARPQLATVSQRSLLTWITRDATTKRQGLIGKFIDGPDTETFAIVDPEAGHDPQAIAVSRMSIEDRGAVAWVGPQTNPGVWVQPLDDTGHPEGGPIKLTDRVGASSSVDLAPRIDGGGAVYSIVIDQKPQVRFRRLNARGMPRDEERALIPPPQRAQDASIAGLGGGYAVVYRSLPPDGQATGAEIRLIFISKEGNVSRDDQGRVVSFPIGDSTLASGRTQVEISLDGVLMIGWLDANPAGDGNLLRIARRSLTCSL